MDGILIVDKPQGWTSFDVCAKLRNLTQTKKVGHSGTLDPMATGVLPVFLGKATKLIQGFMADDKVYVGEMVLGVTTDTGDAEGQITNDKLQTTNNTKITIKEIQNLFRKYTGEIEQIPPMFSAKKINGQPLYKLARKGIIVERQPRKIRIFELRFLEPENELLGSKNQRNRDVQSQVSLIQFYVHCSKGTYIRQLVVDIGEDLGTGAHLSALRRIKSGKFTIEEAITMDALIGLAQEGKLQNNIQII
ncbi:tRNA pseudouridine(55) synthase TruB [Candidatus Saganbacteria bacterium]|nr:tRNA pseudouridine(55) synthase TruB [Candidatus Saganbacteria bacterium]